MWRSRRLWQSSQQRMFSSSRFLIDPQVQKALANGEPVVALESTIVSHGMPYPQNLEVAQEVESILREKVRVVYDPRVPFRCG
jgi:pseudouridine-5'-phosphate glycosidase